MVRFCSPLRPSHHHVCVSSPFRAAPCRATPRYTALRRTRGRYRINVSLITYPAAATPPFSSTGISPPSNRLRQPPLRPLPPPPPPSPFCSIDPSPLPTCLPSVPRYPPLPPKTPPALASFSFPTFDLPLLLSRFVPYCHYHRCHLLLLLLFCPFHQPVLSFSTDLTVPIFFPLSGCFSTLSAEPHPRPRSRSRSRPRPCPHPPPRYGTAC